MPATKAGPTCGSPTHAPLQQTVGEARHLRRWAFDPRHLLALAKAVGAAEALKGEKYKPAIFIVKWGKEPLGNGATGFWKSARFVTS